MPPRHITTPTRVPVPGGKQVLEYVGVPTTGTRAVSIAHMVSPPGWSEPGQRPEFDEWTVVLGGVLQVEYETGIIEVEAGEAVHAPAGEWVRYSTPDGAEYVAVCAPAFTNESVHRDADNEDGQ